MSKVLLGMSGGVDSSVSAYLLQQQGYEVIGITMDIGQGIESQREDIDDVIHKLNIEHHYVNLTDAFQKTVVDYFVDTYKKGMTPNPCVVCNKYIKFGLLMDKMKKYDADFMATGHYAQLVRSEKLGVRSGLYFLRRGLDKLKDQSYFLYRLNQDQLSKVLFPIGGLLKTEVREIAKDVGFMVSEKKDSLEVCFIDGNNYREFLKERKVEEIEGCFIDKDGNVLGKHSGLINYTIGQRRNLGITFGKPMFVVAIDAEKNAVVLGEQDELLKKEFEVTDTSWTFLNEKRKVKSEEMLKIINKRVIGVKVRSQAEIVEATLEDWEDNKIKVVFDKPQRAITPGQSAVFYDDDVVLGGGVII
ncbi:MAG TPA: tRNA 2-thiouridine(34) synthase MnmA [Candidatus Dojkabacteria bacterium]|nr:tRNA 2-thiouridine(34) synthase MnmA [Candidatus Dojkabacteria bacterium]HQF36950.1 tRNA 2-thiouridine(34) synthase MnmA [Candidatus Dojkabacteria bacterium]